LHQQHSLYCASCQEDLQPAIIPDRQKLSHTCYQLVDLESNFKYEGLPAKY
jgi:hypothetical protein